MPYTARNVISGILGDFLIACGGAMTPFSRQVEVEKKSLLLDECYHMKKGSSTWKKLDQRLSQKYLSPAITQVRYGGVGSKNSIFVIGKFSHP